jgi:hypothetical protein
VRPGDRKAAAALQDALMAFDDKVHALPGIKGRDRRQVFIEQVIESIRRVRYVGVLNARKISAASADPQKDCFDPLKAAIVHQRNGDSDEAFWLVFMFVHFGKHGHGGWRYIREIYGKFGEGGLWDWASTSTDVDGFRAWLHTHTEKLKRKNAPGGFGNHRKYESLNAKSEKGTGAVVDSYVKWVGPPRTHAILMADALAQAGNSPSRAFATLYDSMDALKRFGRTARFDYLTMVGKLALANIAPGSPYMVGATGPLKGAALLFRVAGPATKLDDLTRELGNHLGVGMQVMEDSLCNWQKSPAKFKPFRG